MPTIRRRAHHTPPPVFPASKIAIAGLTLIGLSQRWQSLASWLPVATRDSSCSAHVTLNNSSYMYLVITRQHVTNFQGILCNTTLYHGCLSYIAEKRAHKSKSKRKWTFDSSVSLMRNVQLSLTLSQTLYRMNCAELITQMQTSQPLWLKNMDDFAQKIGKK